MLVVGLFLRSTASSDDTKPYMFQNPLIERMLNPEGTKESPSQLGVILNTNSFWHFVYGGETHWSISLTGIGIKFLLFPLDLSSPQHAWVSEHRKSWLKMLLCFEGKDLWLCFCMVMYHHCYIDQWGTRLGIRWVFSVIRIFFLEITRCEHCAFPIHGHTYWDFESGPVLFLKGLAQT